MPSPAPVKLPALKRQWSLRAPDPVATRALVQKAGIDPMVAGLLVGRGICTAKDARAFLSPRLADLYDPQRLRGLPEAVALILDTLDRGEKLTIYGDYDVDGMTASSTLARFLRQCGYDPEVFLPDRFKDGYGINQDRVVDLVEAGTRLFVSVDCGITATRQIARARELGAAFVVVDHHLLPDGPLPDANAIINPLHPECDYPFKGLCAAGLAFHLVLGLRAELRRRGAFLDRPEPDVRDLLDIVAIGTVADIVPLRSVNRILVAAGLRRMARSPHPGVRALLAVGGANQRRLSAEVIGYQMGPRLNAAGRLSHPYKGFELLATDDEAQARAIAADIDEENQRRREVQAKIEVQALEQAMSAQGPTANAFVLWSADWHPGVAGIVAARVMNRFHRPCAVLAVDQDGVAKGSIRSIRGCDAVTMLRQCAPHLSQFGGHAHAAGVTLSADNLDAFRQAFDSAAAEIATPEAFTPTLTVDAELGFDQVNGDLLDAIEQLGPFGAANPAPRFCTRGVRVMDSRVVGKDRRHLKLSLEHGGVCLDAIAFGFADQAPEAGALIDVAFRPDLNEFRGRVTLQLRIADLQAPQEADTAP